MSNFGERLARGENLSVLEKSARLPLFPLSWLYGLGAGARNMLYSVRLLPAYSADVPVVSVGNISCGGTGKTPFVSMLARFVAGQGLKPVVISRGWGRAPDESLNEEARMLSEEGLQVICNPDRVKAAKDASQRYDVILLDDGFQHRRLRRNLDIVLVDATRPLCGDHLLPAGLLRECPSGLSRADFVVMTRGDLSNDTDKLRACIGRKAPGVGIAVCSLVADSLVDAAGVSRNVKDLAAKRVAAYCGIGNPGQFHTMLKSLQAEVVLFRAFPDHHKYTPEDISRIMKEADRYGAEMIITTAKDFVKSRSFDASGKSHILRVRAELTEGREALFSGLLSAIGAKG